MMQVETIEAPYSLVYLSIYLSIKLSISRRRRRRNLAIVCVHNKLYAVDVATLVTHKLFSVCRDPKWILEQDVKLVAPRLLKHLHHVLEELFHIGLHINRRAIAQQIREFIDKLVGDETALQMALLHPWVRVEDGYTLDHTWERRDEQLLLEIHVRVHERQVRDLAPLGFLDGVKDHVLADLHAHVIHATDIRLRDLHQVLASRAAKQQQQNKCQSIPWHQNGDS